MTTTPTPLYRALAVENAARRLEHAAAETILGWAVAAYPRIVLACSFGGPTGMVALDMLARIDPAAPVAYIDTGLLFTQTHALIERIRERYGIAAVAVRPQLGVEEQNDRYGSALWSRDPDACCTLRKVEPQRAFLQNYDAWISGVRRDQSATRRDVPVVQWDARFGLVKVNPFARWDEARVWEYVRAHDLPYNELHDRSYPSAGCVPCTRPVNPGESARAGRWPDSAKTECGLHLAGANREGVR